MGNKAGMKTYCRHEVFDSLICENVQHDKVANAPARIVQ